MSKNKESTRYYSDRQEKSVAKALCGWQQSNSGAGHFAKGDVIVPNTMLIECKCSMSPKQSVSIKKEWIEKNIEEARAQRMGIGAIAFNFEPDGKNYYVIDEQLMKALVEHLREYYDESNRKFV